MSTDYEIQQVIDNAGFTRRLGTLIAPPGLKSSFPAYEASQKMLTAAEIEDVARSGKISGKSRFPEDDWIKNQHNTGGCNGWAMAMALARARVLRGLKRVDLSGAYAYSRMNGGRDNGSLLEDGMKNMEQYGVAPFDMVRWDQIYRNKYDTTAADAAAARFKGKVYVAGTKDGWYSGLARGYVGVCAVHVNDNFMRMSGEGIAGVDNGPGNHAVLAEGLSWRGMLTEDGANSWDLTYGVRGRMGMIWDHHAQTFGYHVHYLVWGSIDDPQGEEPPVIKL